MRLDHLLSREKAEAGMRKPIPGRTDGGTHPEEKEHGRHASQTLKEWVDKEEIR